MLFTSRLYECDCCDGRRLTVDSERLLEASDRLIEEEIVDRLVNEEEEEEEEEEGVEDLGMFPYVFFVVDLKGSLSSLLFSSLLLLFLQLFSMWLLMLPSPSPTSLSPTSLSFWSSGGVQ